MRYTRGDRFYEHRRVDRELLTTTRDRGEHTGLPVAALGSLTTATSWELYHRTPGDHRPPYDRQVTRKLGRPSTTARRRIGERRIVVGEHAFYWHIPRRANEAQHDVEYGLVAHVRSIAEPRACLAIVFPFPHADAYRGNAAQTAEERTQRRARQLSGVYAATAVTPRDIASAIRSALADGWTPLIVGRRTIHMP